MANPFFTIGHSTHTMEEFVALLTSADVKLVVDVGTVPRSRTNPQFNRDILPGSVAAHGVAYEHFAVLGGLRGKQPGVPAEANAFWKNASFHNYADYALSEEFRSGFEKLRALVTPRARPSCARKASGGDAIAGSLQTISSPRARKRSTSSPPVTSRKHI